MNEEAVPVFVSDYVLADIGTGAVMGVPGHDERDYEFAKEKVLEIRLVIEPKEKQQNVDNLYTGEGTTINSGPYDGLESKVVSERILKKLSEKRLADKEVSYHLRDWIFSRQRYWGEPIPMIFCQDCAEKGMNWWKTAEGKKFQESHKSISKLDQNIAESLNGWFPLKEEELPLVLPKIDSYEPAKDGKSPLAKVEDWVKTTCPNCGREAQRETDTMPNWAGSCWYFIRFADPKNTKQAWSEVVKKWLPVDWYLGGAEHAVLHLLYARFWVKALFDLKLIDFHEPFLRLRNTGMILAEDHRKMSKSYGNVINPDDVVAEFGADTLRLPRFILIFGCFAYS